MTWNLEFYMGRENLTILVSFSRVCHCQFCIIVILKKPLCLVIISYFKSNIAWNLYFTVYKFIFQIPICFGIGANFIYIALEKKENYINFFAITIFIIPFKYYHLTIQLPEYFRIITHVFASSLRKVIDIGRECFIYLHVYKILSKFLNRIYAE